MAPTKEKQLTQERKKSLTFTLFSAPSISEVPGYWTGCVAKRALDPASKLHLEHWVANEVYIEGLPSVDSQNLYRAMDFLQEHSDVLQQAICMRKLADHFSGMGSEISYRHDERASMPVRISSL